MITNIAVKGSNTSCGGTITTGNAKFLVNGKEVACIGDTHDCPIHGINSITSVCVDLFSVDGKKVAHIGSICSCGASITTGEELKVGD